MQRKREKMDTNTIIVLAISAVIFLLIGGALGVVFTRRQRTKRLRDRFGPEYDRVLEETGDRGRLKMNLKREWTTSNHWTSNNYPENNGSDS
jgi:hypothetical protein